MTALSPAYRLLEGYYGTIWDAERPQIARDILRLAQSGADATANDALLHVLNDEGDEGLRLAIVEYLHSTHSPAVIGGLGKALFDGAPAVRARAAVALSEYTSAFQLAGVIGPLLDAVSDPATRSPAEVAIRTVTGRAPDKITASERERVRLGEHARSIWPDHFAKTPAESANEDQSR